MTQFKQIETLAERIRADFGVSVHICAEIEWLFHQEGAVPDTFFEALLQQAQADDVRLESIGREVTNLPNLQQYEFRFRATDPAQAAEAIIWLREQIKVLAKTYKLSPECSAFSEQGAICSGLHWHLHLLDADENYLFMKQESQMTPPLAHTLAGLLHTMPALMFCFASSDNAYTRLRSGADHVPTKACWSGNNRSVALRMPESVIPLRHVEHRVCGADADPIASIWAILVGIHYGFTHQPALPEPCYGDANRPESEFPFLPNHYRDAQHAMQQANWLAAYSEQPAQVAECLGYLARMPLASS